ncbi:TonB-dependent receptor plug domain-containing protein [Sphingobacterium corticibacter]|uniref:TonB-dependent receptor n=1 Tax=Sphingobacterium corticibacter TaxID=2171749 RepID=A0A2T8HMQ9_9SPHI|nr:TonB-dependent receptor [Sphingobacterium corticibacter]PVH26706.1 TonB-dependent receptor [Sphingobacterium corticibacter]
MRLFISFLLILFVLSSSFAQTDTNHRDKVKTLEKVSIFKRKKKKLATDVKLTALVDELLGTSDNISFIKRGAYAWEPLLNNMTTERSVITVDGMHVFGACTDKMDPISSYMESNSISSIKINSGQHGNMQGATVAGSIDLQRISTPFGQDKAWSGSYQTGFEFNNNQTFNLGNISYSSAKFVADGSVGYRKAGNYTDGSGNEINHSQYSKFNTSLGLAYKTSELSSIKVDAIFDQANNVGFPALPMDLWLSRAIITAASYQQQFETGLLRVWDTKAYFNAIEHYMDDTNRPENLVHMDMPGWSTTYGLTSRVELKQGSYQGELQLNAYDNLSIAEMTMYPQDRSERTMFAYTWPWVTTRYAGVSSSNTWNLSPISEVNIGASVGTHYNYARYSEFNRIFYPEASESKTRFLPSLNARYQLSLDKFRILLGTGFGQRAPSVSEGYGYYIYNSFDLYDYIGNPDLPNETSYEVNAAINYESEKWSISSQVNAFHIRNYIVGKILSIGSPMNYQSVGVKAYSALEYARLFNIAISGRYDILQHLHWKGTLTYARATDNNSVNLPFIRPLHYQSSLQFMHKKMGIQAAINGDLSQNNFSPEYGETPTQAYAVFDLSGDYTFNLGKHHLTVQVGIENMFDSFYTTYADWGNIPRMGRNVFTTLKTHF